MHNLYQSLSSCKPVMGIYKITCIVTDKYYIGSSTNVRKRCLRHLNVLTNNSHENAKLQRAFNKYGKESFKWELLEECNKNTLRIREQYYLDTLRPYEETKGFNILKSTTYNIKPSTTPNEEAIKQLWTEERKQKYREMNIARFRENELVKENHSFKQKENWKNPDYRARVIATKNSPEYIKAQSDRNKLYWSDPEYRTFRNLRKSMSESEKEEQNLQAKIANISSFHYWKLHR